MSSSSTRTVPVSAWDEANMFDQWTFRAANPMLRKGLEKPLEFDDLMHIPQSDHSLVLMEKLKSFYMQSTAISIIPRLMVAILRTTWTYVIITVVGTLIEGVIRIALPLVLVFLLRDLQDGDGPGAYRWAAVIAALGFAQAIVHHILFFFSMRMGWNWKTATTAFIYDTLFKLDGVDMQSLLTGKMVNMISNDVSRIDEFACFAIYTWESFLEVAVILLVLIYILNVPAAFAGVGTTFLFIPPMLLLAGQFAKFRGKTAAATDSRVRHISEIVDGIAQVKAYAWETPFFDMIAGLRKREVRLISNTQTLRAVNLGLMFCTPAIVSLVTFGVFWGAGGTLTIPLVFSTISLLQVLRTTIGWMWARSIETGSDAAASCIRVESFLDKVYAIQDDSSTAKKGPTGVYAAVPQTVQQQEQCTESAASLEMVHVQPQLDANDNIVLGVHASQCFYGTTSVLSDVSVDLRRGKVTMIVGPVGSGKSSLLAAMLGEMKLSEGGVLSRVPNSTIAYCAQKAWIVAASVKANVTIAGRNEAPDANYKQPKTVDADMYRTALESCLMVDDLLQWPAYDETEIGERGVSISGGQRARISLARAVYANSDVYLLDDPLSAVDAHVGVALMQGCILKTLRDQNKAVALVTHQLQYLSLADEIVVLNKLGQQIFCGDYAEFCAQHDRLQFLEVRSEHSVSKVDFVKNGEEEEQAEGGSGNTPRDTTSQPPKPRTPFDPQFLEKRRREKEQQSADTVTVVVETPEEALRRQIIATEDKKIGDISMGVYWHYLTAGGKVRGTFVLTLILISQGVSMITDYWLRWWATSTFGDQSSYKYMLVLGILVGICIVMGFYRALAWFRFALHASSHLHEQCFWSVLHSPLTFFNSNPTGRILNRFTRDQSQADELLPVTFFTFLQSIVFCFSSIVLVCITIPWLVLLMPVLFGVFILLRQKYMASSREIKRWEAITRSPIYSDFSATLDGIVTLRAYGLQEKVTTMFLRQLDDNGRAWFSFLMCARWLGYRLDMESAVILAFVALFAVWLRDSVDVGLIGFALVYTMSLSALFQWSVRLSAEVESQMTAVERIHAYGQLPPEEGFLHDGSLTKHRELLRAGRNRGRSTSGGSFSGRGSRRGDEHGNKEKELPLPSAVLGGVVEFKNLTVRYRDDLDPVLQSLSFRIPAGSKVGICGRTGSGKSSTLMALLRLNIVSEGDILVNDKSLLTTDLQAARSQVALIPQEPHLFSGTVRFNLDPFSRHSDTELWAALSDAHFADYIRSLPDQLLAGVDEGGKNFSVGQRQLLSLARAILRRCSVVLMDEVTASIDFQTDRMIQETIRTSAALKHATILTVAHRLRTIADSDIIIVVDQGRLAEMDSPYTLLTAPQFSQSLYKQLAQQSGEFEEILRAAQSKVPVSSEVQEES